MNYDVIVIIFIGPIEFGKTDGQPSARHRLAMWWKRYQESKP